MVHTGVSLENYGGKQHEVPACRSGRGNYSYFPLNLFVFRHLGFILGHRFMKYSSAHIESFTITVTSTTTTPQSAGI